MPLTQRIHDQLQACIQVLSDAGGSLAEPLGTAARAMTDCLLAEGKILTCGVGPSGLAARHLAAILVDRLDKERPGLAAIALHGDGAGMVDEADFSPAFARQIAALGHPGDLLVVFSVYGQARAVVEAIHAAHERDLRVVVLAGGDGGQAAEILTENDVLICLPAESAARIHEVTLFAVHALCDGIDYFLLGA